MALACYLAMTAAEIAACPSPPENFAWMACHFAPYGTGLSNYPRLLAQGGMLILNDRTPVHGHEPGRVADELAQAADAMNCRCVLLDLQRPDCRETEEIVRAVTQSISCPVGVSVPYAAGLSCPVFLPPCPLHMPIGDFLSPWLGREIWLEAALSWQHILLTPQGTVFSACPPEVPPASTYSDKGLHCHYWVDIQNDQAQFTLFSTKEMLVGKLQEAEALGVTQAIGLYQELGEFPSSL